MYVNDFWRYIYMYMYIYNDMYTIIINILLFNLTL